MNSLSPAIVVQCIISITRLYRTRNGRTDKQCEILIESGTTVKSAVSYVTDLTETRMTPTQYRQVLRNQKPEIMKCQLHYKGAMAN